MPPNKMGSTCHNTHKPHHSTLSIPPTNKTVNIPLLFLLGKAGSAHGSVSIAPRKAHEEHTRHTHPFGACGGVVVWQLIVDAELDGLVQK
eukprot:scaffold3851_cov162-Amphora_coffeaeformis.AAC.7